MHSFIFLKDGKFLLTKEPKQGDNPAIYASESKQGNEFQQMFKQENVISRNHFQEMFQLEQFVYYHQTNIFPLKTNKYILR